MAFIAYGRRVDLTWEVVQYAFGIDEADPDAGVLAIPVRDPEAWYVEGRSERPKAAVVVAGKAIRLWKESGEWPEWASFFA